MYTGEMFERDGVDEAMAGEGVSGRTDTLREPWLAHVHEIFAEATLTVPAPDAWMQKGGRQGRHTENLGYILAEMQFLQRAYPGAQW
jgi:ring-1,2-phenylacetyl-CoA epoxidase subunit PaaC